MNHQTGKRYEPAPIEVQQAFEALNRQLFDGLIDWPEYERQVSEIQTTPRAGS